MRVTCDGGGWACARRPLAVDALGERVPGKGVNRERRGSGGMTLSPQVSGYVCTYVQMWVCVWVCVQRRLRKLAGV